MEQTMIEVPHEHIPKVNEFLKLRADFLQVSDEYDKNRDEINSKMDKILKIKKHYSYLKNSKFLAQKARLNKLLNELKEKLDEFIPKQYEFF